MSKFYLPNGDLIVIHESWSQEESLNGNLDYYTRTNPKKFLGTLHSSGVLHLTNICSHTLHKSNANILDACLKQITDTGVNNFGYSDRKKLKQLKKLLHQLDARK